MRHITSASVALAFAILAMCLGYMHYKAAPIGDLFYTPMDRCPNYSHSFTTGYLLTLVIEAALWILIAGGAWLVARWSGKAIALPLVLSIRPTVIGLAILAAAALAHPVFESQLPLQPDPRCVRYGP